MNYLEEEVIENLNNQYLQDLVIKLIKNLKTENIELSLENIELKQKIKNLEVGK